jgi:ABC-type maltose transport system permease subunit
MTTVLAVTRPTEWNVPLFVHVLGAMILVGGLLTGVSALAFARGEAHMLRLGYWSLLTVALPGYIVMRVGAQWIYSKEGWDDLPDEAVPAWLDIGFIVADAGALLTIIALILGGFGVRRLRDGKGAGLLKATMVIALLVLAAALVAVWAMSGKPN